MSHRINYEELWDGAYGLLSISEKTRKSNHLQRESNFQLFKDPECWSGQGFEPATSRMVVRLYQLSRPVSSYLPFPLTEYLVCRSKIEKVDFKGKKFYLTVKGKEVISWLVYCSCNGREPCLWHLNAPIHLLKPSHSEKRLQNAGLSLRAEGLYFPLVSWGISQLLWYKTCMLTSLLTATRISPPT